MEYFFIMLLVVLVLLTVIGLIYPRLYGKDKSRLQILRTYGSLIVVCIIGIFAFTADGESGSKSVQNTSTPNTSTQWFKGGNLHSATVAQWKSASYRNKLATAADWLAVTTWEGHLNSGEDFDNLKGKAVKLVAAVDQVVDVKGTESLQVAEIALTIINASSDLGP